MVSFPARPADDPDPLKPETPSRARTQLQIEELASRLEAQGIRSPDLVLDLVLHDLADEARQAVNATGAAVALERDGELVCRAAAGSTAPDLGVRIHMDSGLSGVCVKQRQTQICKDTECDDRVDAEACRRLGVRSIVVIPLFSAGRIIGIFEVFSPRPNAYTAEDVKKLESLAHSAAQTMQTARRSSGASVETNINPHPESVSNAAPALSVQSILEQAGPIDPAVRLLRWLVIGLAMPLLVLIGFDLGWHRMSSPGPVRVPVAEQSAEAEPQRQAPPAALLTSPATSPPAKVAPKPNPRDDISSRGGLVIYQNGKIVYREFANTPAKSANSPQGQSVVTKPVTGAAPSPESQGGTSEGSSTVSLPDGITGGRLLKSVRPQYPAEAILAKRAGPVVMHGVLGQDGMVRDLKIVSGDALLSPAAVEAVQQWKYEPYRRNGKPVTMPIDITIEFNLPK